MKKVLRILGLIIAACILLLVLGRIGTGCFIEAGNYYRAYTSRYTVTGEVTSSGSKLRFGETAEEKYGLALSTKAGPTIVNCDSTQCSALASGQQIELSCFVESNWPEPPEEECRFVRVIAAK